MNISERFQAVTAANAVGNHDEVIRLCHEILEEFSESPSSHDIDEPSFLAIPADERMVAVFSVFNAYYKRARAALPPPEMPPELVSKEKELIAFIQEEPVVMSLLYDLNLLPEVISSRAPEGRHRNGDWIKMLNIIAHIKEVAERQSITMTSPHLGEWSVSIDEHGATVFKLGELTQRFSDEALLSKIFEESFEYLKSPAKGVCMECGFEIVDSTTHTCSKGHVGVSVLMNGVIEREGVRLLVRNGRVIQLNS